MSGPNLERNKSIKAYEAPTLDIESLIGRKVVEASINADKDVVCLYTDKGQLWLTWSGDCCAHCYLANVSGAANLVGAEILSAEHAEWVDVSREEYGEVVESMGTKLVTTKGYVDLETRVAHNGYYGGQIVVSDLGPIDNYSCVLEEPDDLAPLKDF